MPEPLRQALSIPNVRLFLYFRILFNARFYYPVFTVLFLDMGITLEQFALLNTIWAATIVLCEVPSGALADILGRRRLVVFAAVLMVLEMILLLCASTLEAGWLFALLVLNRLFSGLAEASASGADEALAYDSLKEAGQEQSWPAVLAILMRYQSIAFFVAMLSGAALFDPAFVNAVLNFAGVNLHLAAADSRMLPVLFTALTGVTCLFVALRLQGLRGEERRADWSLAPLAFRQTFAAGRWIARTPFVLLVILAGMAVDGTARLFITLASEYYRVIDLPPVTFGIWGSLISLQGLLWAPVARRLAEQHSPLFNLGVMSAFALIGFIGLSQVIPYYGLVFVFVLMTNFPLINFFLSHYLNARAESSRRATVLSFKGLALNLSYGTFGLLYAALISQLKAQPALAEATPEVLQESVFVSALGWFAPAYLVLIVALFFTARLLLKDRSPCLKPVRS